MIFQIGSFESHVNIPNDHNSDTIIIVSQATPLNHVAIAIGERNVRAKICSIIITNSMSGEMSEVQFISLPNAKNKAWEYFGFSRRFER